MDVRPAPVSADITVPVRTPGAAASARVAARGTGSVLVASARVAARGTGSVPLETGMASREIASARRAAALTRRVAAVPTTVAVAPHEPDIRRSLEPHGLPARRMPGRTGRCPRINTAHRRTGGSQGVPPLRVETTADHRARVAVRAADIAARIDRLGTPMTANGGAVGPRRAPVAGAGMRRRVSRAACVTGVPTAQPATDPTGVAVLIAVALRVPVAGASPMAGGPRVPVAGASPTAGAPRGQAVTGGTPVPRTGRGAAGATGTRRTTNRPGARVRPGVPRSRSHPEPIPSCWTPRSARSSGR